MFIAPADPPDGQAGRRPLHQRDHRDRGAPLQPEHAGTGVDEPPLSQHQGRLELDHDAARQRGQGAQHLGCGPPARGDPRGARNRLQGSKHGLQPPPPALGAHALRRRLPPGNVGGRDALQRHDHRGPRLRPRARPDDRRRDRRTPSRKTRSTTPTPSPTGSPSAKPAPREARGRSPPKPLLSEDLCKTPSKGRTPPAGLGKGSRRGVLRPLPLGEGWGEGGGRRGPRDLAQARPPSYAKVSSGRD